MDHELLARELVRALRGDRSQRQLARRLQYTTNVIYLWESGRRWPTAATFLWLAHRTGADVAVGLDALCPGAWELGHAEPWHPQAVAAWLRGLQGGRTATELARQLGKSRDAVGRWLRGEAEPRLPDLLRFVEVCSTRLLDFVAGFVDPAALSTTAQPWSRLWAARRMTREQPWAPAVLLALELADYQALGRHDDGWLADRLGLEEVTVNQCLTLLRDAGQLRWDGRRWHRVATDAVDTRARSNPWDLKQFWGQVGLERMATAEGTVSFTVCAISQADFEGLQEQQLQHYRDLRARIAASEPGERVVLVHLQTVALDGGRTVRGASASEKVQLRSRS